MRIYSFCNDKKQGLLNFDPRTKILLLIMGNIAIFLSSTLMLKMCLFMAFVIFGFLCGTYKFSVKMAILFYGLIAVQYVSGHYLTGMFSIMLITFAQFFCMLLPCMLLGGIMISTTRVNEFMAALNKMHVHKTIVIPLTVMMRYFPMVSKDWKYIKDAMRMRDITPSFLGFIKQPSLTIECVYVPMMMSASKVADELSAAAVTRGIENPYQRTCMVKMKMQSKDIISIVLLAGVILIEVLGGVLLG